MDQQKPDLKNQNASPANADAGVGAEAPASAIHAPAPDSAPSAAPTPAKADGKANPAPTTDPKKGPAGKDKKKPPKAYRPIPNETYLRRRKQKRVALVVLGIAAVGVFILGMVAFLGNWSGQFTVKIDPKADLTMDGGTDGSFTTKTSYLKATGLENASTYLADNLPDDAVIDDKPGGSKNGYFSSEKHPDSKIGQYMAYTFFVKNVAKEETSFEIRLNIDGYNNGADGTCSLIDIVRLRLYSNPVTAGVADTHDCVTYANIAADGQTPEVVSPDVGVKDENKALSTPFQSDKLVFSEDYALESQAAMRYTVVMWLEPSDPECYGKAPEGAFVSFSMFFTVI